MSRLLIFKHRFHKQISAIPIESIKLYGLRYRQCGNLCITIHIQNMKHGDVYFKFSDNNLARAKFAELLTAVSDQKSDINIDEIGHTQ